MRKILVKKSIINIIKMVAVFGIMFCALLPLIGNKRVSASMQGCLATNVRIVDMVTKYPLEDEFSSLNAKVYLNGKYLYDAKETSLDKSGKRWLEIPDSRLQSLELGDTFVIEFSVPENYALKSCELYLGNSDLYSVSGNKLTIIFTPDVMKLFHDHGLEFDIDYYNGSGPQEPKNINDCQISLSKASYTYTGKRIEPKVQIKDGTYTLKKDTDYLVSYEYNVSPGTARINILGIGKYTEFAQIFFTIKLAAPKLVNAKSADYDSITVSWKKVEKADSYNLYYKGGTVKTWTLVRSGITGTSYTHKSSNLLTGTKYTYTVRAVYEDNQKGNSDYKKVGVSAKPTLNKAVISQIISTGSGLKITWKKVSGSTGYVIQRLDNGKWTNIKVIQKGTNTAWTDTSTKPGREYTYRARAFRKVNGKRVFGPYSNLVSYA